MFRIKNAIILAAGRGSRMRELTDSIPKPLLKINDLPIIENIINELQKVTKNIIIVTGYLAEQFEYLKSKFKNIKIILNKEWENNNNVTSINAVKEHLSNTLIVNGDIIINNNNLFRKWYKTPLFYVEQNKNIDEWFTIFDKNKNIIDFDKNGLGKEGFYQREVCVLNKKLSNLIRSNINNFDKQEYYEFLVLQCSKKYGVPVKAFEVGKEDIFDLDSKERFEEHKSLKEK